MSKATEKLKKTRVYVQNSAESAEAQTLMFAMGFRWGGEDKTLYAGRHFNGGWLYVNSNCRITYCCSGPWESDHRRVITMQELRDALEAHKAEKREHKKASRKRKQLRKQGWIPFIATPTSVSPVQGGQTVVEFKLVNGEEAAYENNYLTWNIPKNWPERAIVAYRIKQPKSEVVSADQMFEAIAKDMGKGVAVAPADEGWIEWNGHKYDTVDNFSGPVAEGTMVDVKSREGVVYLNQPAGQLRGDRQKVYPAGAFWRKDNTRNDIVAYRIVKQEEKPVLGECQVLAPIPEAVPDTNPKRQYGVSSVPLNMWSPLASAYGALGLYNGSLKYGKANFANTPVEASIYIAAALRHLMAWACGQEDDPADGVPNLGGVLANIAILLEARAAGMLIDDRLKMAGYLKEIEMLKEKVKHLNQLHAGKTPKHYTLGE